MSASVGLTLPIVADGRLWGAMSVNSRNDLPPDTEERLERFTDLVATAVANAQAREQMTALADEQAALRRVATLVASGAVAGMAVSLWLSRFVASLLYGVQPHDTTTLLGAVIVLASVGLVAGAIPASKAARTNPATVLREG